MNTKWWTLSLALMLAGCGSYSQVTQVDDKAYLLVRGNATGGTLFINNSQSINLDTDVQSYRLEGRRAIKIEIPIGQHKIRIVKNGQTVIRRRFFVATGESYEVNL